MIGRAANDRRYPFDQWAFDPCAWDCDTGAPGIILFGNAVQVWAIMQNHSAVSVADAARAFNVAPERIIEAVEDHQWMRLMGPRDDLERLIIEHDGE